MVVTDRCLEKFDGERTMKNEGGGRQGYICTPHPRVALIEQYKDQIINHYLRNGMSNSINFSYTHGSI